MTDDRSPPDTLYLQPYEAEQYNRNSDESDLEYLLATPERRAAPDLLKALERARNGNLALAEMGILTGEYAKAALEYAEEMSVAIRKAKETTND